MHTRLIVSCLCLAAVLCGLPVCAYADDLTNPWQSERERYIQGLTETDTGSLIQRRSAYISQISGNSGQWWADWESRQPYSTDQGHAFKAGAEDIPPEPGIASTSPFGQNITDLMYSNIHNPRKPPSQDRAEPAPPPSVLAAERKALQKQGSAIDIDSKINSASYPSQLPTGPSDANRSNAPIRPMDVQRLMGK